MEARKHAVANASARRGTRWAHGPYLGRSASSPGKQVLMADILIIDSGRSGDTPE